ncbi:MAG: type II toxin-antitoxin system RelE/ParE family toxin [Pseudomonadota bacterium]
MNYRVRFTKAAREDLRRLYNFLLDKDLRAARRARDAILKALEFLQDFPFSCRKVDDDNPFVRELIIPFGSAGYVALFEIEDQSTVTVLAIRHQREDDYH